MSDTIRGEYWLEASDCISKANRRDMADPLFWALTLSALVNATMAAVPSDVLDEVEIVKVRRQVKQRKVQKDIRKDLKV